MLEINLLPDIQTLKESNEHEIEKLMKQHEVDLDNLKETHKLEMEKLEAEHRYSLELANSNAQNEMTTQLIGSMVGNVMMAATDAGFPRKFPYRFNEERSTRVATYTIGHLSSRMLMLTFLRPDRFVN